MISWFEHGERVRDAREAAALVKALGATRVRLTQPSSRAWVIKDRAAIARVLATLEPGSSSDIAIEGITREATLPLLAELVAGDAQNIFIAGNGTSLLVWPRRNEAFVGPLAIGRATAFERFRDACAVTWINANVREPGADIVACLPRLLAELDQPEIEVDLDLAVDTALELALAFPDAELQWTGGAVIELPAGTIATYKLEPPADFEAEWRARIAGALARIRSSA